MHRLLLHPKVHVSTRRAMALVPRCRHHAPLHPTPTTRHAPAARPLQDSVALSPACVSSALRFVLPPLLSPCLRRTAAAPPDTPQVQRSVHCELQLPRPYSLSSAHCIDAAAARALSEVPRSSCAAAALAKHPVHDALCIMCCSCCRHPSCLPACLQCSSQCCSCLSAPSLSAVQCVLRAAAAPQPFAGQGDH